MGKQISDPGKQTASLSPQPITSSIERGADAGREGREFPGHERSALSQNRSIAGNAAEECDYCAYVEAVKAQASKPSAGPLPSSRARLIKLVSPMVASMTQYL